MARELSGGRSRNLVIGIVLVVTVATATIVILYVQGSKGGVIDHAALATAFVSKRDIHRGQELDPLIEQGVIIDLDVPARALVVGAVTDLRQLRGSTAFVDIRRNEQISANDVGQLDDPTP
jgi:hypothetical protein